MPLTLAETPLYYKDSQGQYHRVLSGADMTGYRTAAEQDAVDTAARSQTFKNITASVTGSTTAGENAWKYVPVTIPDGYRMFAVNSLRFSGTDANYIVLRGFEVDNSNSRVTLFFKNTTTSTTINYTATIWITCAKSDLF